ncbi:AsnC family protein [Ignatzschineria rhizosphaerae]|uniref:AsnC family protein n=2 Tax=Ignatzschineria rhizosphaerae TaxID=2923279 RepID=A0ABY3X713_9GAMM|nr:AsnC family protein [Ignatzschineria rhizosphaerae]
MDKTDQRILKILKENAKCSLKEIGSIVHKSGQAVGIRIKKIRRPTNH